MSDALNQPSGDQPSGDQTTSGWRRDPSGRYEWRWWDGHGWTNRVANPAPPASAPAVAPAPATTGPPNAFVEPAAALIRPAPQASPVVMPAPEVPAPQTSAVATALAPPAPAPASPAVPTAPATLPSPARPDPVADPFAALRAPRNSAPMHVAEHEPVALTGDPGAAPASATPVVRTYPTAHDGTSGSKWDGPYLPETPGAKPVPKQRQGLAVRGMAAVASFFRSFWEQEESYHSPKAGAQLPPHPKQQALQPPANYGRAGLVMLAALGVAIGAYLPWITYRIDDLAHHRTGADLGAAWSFVLASAAFAIAAVLGAKHRVMGWVTMAASVVVAGMVAVRLLEVHDQVVSLNAGPTVSAEVGIGLWIMLASAAIGLIAAFRLDTPAEIV